MAALSSAESPPPVFNGDAAERQPGRERGLEEPGSGFNAVCTTRMPGGAQNEEVSAATLWLAGLTWGKGSGLQAEVRNGNVLETGAVTRAVFDVTQRLRRLWRTDSLSAGVDAG